MSRLAFDMQQPRSSRILASLAVLSFALGACGGDSEPLESSAQASVRQEALNEEPCTLTAYSPPPTMTISDAVITLKCDKDDWEIPEVTATDACGRPLEVHRYNTGDDDGDGVPGSIDPDDFGPGPDMSTEGLYYVQFLAWDEAYNITGAILDVHVVKCHKK